MVEKRRDGSGIGLSGRCGCGRCRCRCRCTCCAGCGRGGIERVVGAGDGGGGVVSVQVTEGSEELGEELERGLFVSLPIVVGGERGRVQVIGSENGG